MTFDFTGILTGEITQPPKMIPERKKNYPGVLQTYWDKVELQEAYQKYLRVCKEQDQMRNQASGNKIALLKGLQTGEDKEELLRIALETIGDLTGDETFIKETLRLF